MTPATSAPLPQGPPPAVESAPGRVALHGPARDRASRASLDQRVRHKLEELERAAGALHAQLTTASDHVRSLLDERTATRLRLEAARTAADGRPLGSWRRDPAAGPSAMTWAPAAGTSTAEIELDGLEADLARATAERDALQARWQDAARVAERARQFLGIG